MAGFLRTQGGLTGLIILLFVRKHGAKEGGYGLLPLVFFQNVFFAERSGRLAFG